MPVFLDNVMELLPVYAAAQYCQSRVAPQMRESLAEWIIDQRPKLVSPISLEQRDLQLAEKLYAEGAIEFGDVIAPDRLESVVAHFRNTPCFAGHVAAQSDGIRRPVDQARTMGAYGSYTLADALAVPEIFQILVNPRLLAFATSYIGSIPTLYSVHVFWTFKGQEGGTHTFHRDYDDFKFVTLFVYLTEVVNEDGATQFILGSHLSPDRRQPFRDRGMSLPFDQSPTFDAMSFFPPQGRDIAGAQLTQAEEVFAQRKMSMGGKAGTAFLADTYGLHRGTKVVNGDRLACWIRFGLTQNQAYASDTAEPVSLQDLPHVHLPGGQVPWPFRLILKP